MNRRRHNVLQRVVVFIAAATALAVPTAPAMAADPPPFQSFSVEVAALAAAGDTVAFTAARPFEDKLDLWRSLPSGSFELALSPFFDGYRPHSLHSGAGGAFVLEAGRLWRIPAHDGTVEAVEPDGALTPLGSFSDRLFALEGTLSGVLQNIELVATTPAAPLELIRLGRVGVRAPDTPPGPAQPPLSWTPLIAHRGEFVFGVAGSRATDRALDGIWATNGQVNGTRQLVSLPAVCAAACRVERLASNGTQLFFSTGEGLWALGPAGPAVRFARIQPPGQPSSAAFSAFGDMVALGRYLYFAGQTGAYGTELWFSNGTARGTRLFKSLRPGFASSHPEQLLAVANRLFFIANDGAHGRELWTSNGTRAGTRRLTDIAAGPADGIGPQGTLTRLPRGVAFAAANAASGLEPWVSDGTPGGTHLLADVKPGPNGSNPSAFTTASGRLYFTALSENGASLIWVEHPTAGSAIAR